MSSFPEGKSAEVFDAENNTLEALGEKIQSKGGEVQGILETIVGLSKVKGCFSQKLVMYE